MTGSGMAAGASPAVATHQLEVDGLYCRYASGVQALTDVTLRIPTGMFGLLGPNGAGKSTLMRTLATLQRPQRGAIRFGDIDVLAQPERLRATLGYLPQDFGLYPTMPADVTLDHFATLKGLTEARARRDAVDGLLEQVNLSSVRAQPVGEFSGGMRQRLGIAIALLGQPSLVIVDEPTVGLDPDEREQFLNLLADVAEHCVVVLSTHLVEDVRQLCRRLAILDRGRVVLAGETEPLLAGLRNRVWRSEVPREALTALRHSHVVLSSKLSAGACVVHVLSEEHPGEGFTPIAADLGDLYRDTIQRARLER